jgi:nucleoside-diphosphate-sugar epimerase
MNQLSYTVSCDKFRQLGFSFQGSMEQGIRETIEWLRGVRNNATFALPATTAIAS